MNGNVPRALFWRVPRVRTCKKVVRQIQFYFFEAQIQNSLRGRALRNSGPTSRPMNHVA